MMLLNENDKLWYCENCGKRFIWNDKDIRRYLQLLVVQCPNCQQAFQVIADDYELIRQDIKGEKKNEN